MVLLCILGLPQPARVAEPGGRVARSVPADRVGECTPAQRRTALAEDQRLVLARVGDLTRLDDLVDLAALAGRGWNVLPHGWNSFRGMGMAVLRGEEIPRPEPLPGRPELLLYRPDPGASNVTDPLGADFPYQLAGWGYLGSYDFAKHPTSAGSCFTRTDWFVHERGIHDFQTLGFVPVPPKEDFHGHSPGNEPFVPLTPGVPHSRFWDMHVWLGAEGLPTVSMLNPGTPIPGIDPHVGSWFFYPPAFPRPSQAEAKTPPRIRLSVRPRTTRVARQTRFVFSARVASRSRRPVGGATIRFARRKARTDGSGSATIRMRFRSPGSYRARAIKRGMRSGTARVRVLPATRP
jgi:hypothetical protein